MIDVAAIADALPLAPVVEQARVAAARARAAQAVLAHLPNHRPEVKFGAEIAPPSRSVLRPSTALNPSTRLDTAAEQRLARRRALHHIAAATGGADPAGLDPTVLAHLVHVGLAVIVAGRVHPTPLGRQAAAA